MMKKGIPGVLVRSVMSLVEKAKIKVRVESELSEKFDVKVAIHQKCLLQPCLFAIVAYVTELAREGVLSDLPVA